MRIGKSRLNLTAGIRLSKNLFFSDGISGALEGRGVFGTSSQALAISPQLAQAAATFGTTSAAQLPYLAQAANTFGSDHSATASTFTGLLDEYPGAAAAYSIRKLSSTYSGALVEIRRSSDNAVKSFYPDSNNELSLNSEDGEGTSLETWIGSDNGFIRTWYDQSGSGNNLIQTSSGAQPKIIDTGVIITQNSKPSIEFDTAQSFNFTTKIDLSGTTESAGFNVYRTPVNNQNDALLINTLGSRYLTLAYRQANLYTWGTGNILSSSNNILTQKLETSIFNADTSITIKENGVSKGTTATGKSMSIAEADTLLGSSVRNSTVYEQELIIYSTGQSSNVNGIENNINDYFLIY